MISLSVYAQNDRDSTILDLNRLVYKVLKMKEGLVIGEVYYDLAGKSRIIGNYKNLNVTNSKEMDPVYQDLYKQIKFPLKLVGQTDIFKVTVSLIVEKDGRVTNLRFINKSNHEINAIDIVSKKLVVKPIHPVIIEGELVEFEMIKEIVVTCSCGGKRAEKKSLNYKPIGNSGTDL